MKVLNTPEAQIKLSHARRLMSEALEILDELGEQGDVGSHLDLALCRLENHLGLDVPGAGGAQALRAALEEELMASSERATECPWQVQPI